jgi:hypothetical protein
MDAGPAFNCDSDPDLASQKNFTDPALQNCNELGRKIVNKNKMRFNSLGFNMAYLKVLNTNDAFPTLRTQDCLMYNFETKI